MGDSRHYYRRHKKQRLLLFPVRKLRVQFETKTLLLDCGRSIFDEARHSPCWRLLRRPTLPARRHFPCGCRRGWSGAGISFPERPRPGCRSPEGEQTARRWRTPVTSCPNTRAYKHLTELGKSTLARQRVLRIV